MSLSFRDDYYRQLVEFPGDYDKVIDMIIALNPAATGQSKPESNRYSTPEEFACDCVHSCIRSVVYGDAGGWSSTGGCIAARLSKDPESPNYKKVVLAYNGPFVVQAFKVERGKGVFVFAG